VLFRIPTWNVRGIAHKEEELDSLLNKKQIEIAAITESKKKLKATKETNNYIVIYGDIKRST
jgi:exonuclease III